MPIIRYIKKIAYIITAVAFSVTVFSFNTFNVKGNNAVLTVVALNKEYKIYDYETSVYNGIRYLNNAEETVNEIYYDTYEKRKNAEIIFNPNSSDTFIITKGNNGKEIDKNLLLKDISYALNNNVNLVRVKYNEIPQTVTENYLKSCTYLRSRFTTYFTYVKERVENIKLASKYLSGTVVNENEEFSFNNVVGERSEERGFLKAKIILDGEFTDGVGGGVCQVSTTVYNALLLGGVKITEHHPHSLQVGYVEPSFDAMVSYGFSDLKFYNDTGGLIFISVKTTDNSITVSVYGKKPNKTYQRVSVITEEIPPIEEEIIVSGELNVGQSQILQHAKKGIKSEGYLIEYSLTGEREKTRLLRKDSYKSVRQKRLVGSNEENKE